MTIEPITRARIAGLCADALRRSGADGVLPTPLDAVLEAVGVRDRIELAQAPPIADAVRDRLLGAIWFEERALFVDRRQSMPRRRFTEAHEAVHLLCPWHAAALRVDTASELFGALARGIEAEANFGAGQLIFQAEHSTPRRSYTSGRSVPCARWPDGSALRTMRRLTTTSTAILSLSR